LYVYKNSSYQLDWSIGELQTETYRTSGQSLTQGFHQGNYIITEIEQSNQFEAIVYPNPTIDFVILKIDVSATYNKGNLQYRITDISGKILQNEKIRGNIQQINFSGFAIGTYFITIQLNNQFVKSFKIIKTK